MKGEELGKFPAWPGEDVVDTLILVDEAPVKPESSLGKCALVSGFQQVVLLLGAAFVLDGGWAMRSVLIACAAYWVVIALVVLWRREKPYTALDKSFAKWGFLAIWVVEILGCLVYSAVAR